MIQTTGPEPKPVRVNVAGGGELVVDLRWAKRSCRHCHGTGVIGVRLLDGGKRRESILCACVVKEHARRQKAVAADGQ